MGSGVQPEHFEFLYRLPSLFFSAALPANAQVFCAIPVDLPPATYRILAGLYDWKTLERLVVDNDTSGENAVEVETIRFE